MSLPSLLSGVGVIVCVCVCGCVRACVCVCTEGGASPKTLTCNHVYHIILVNYS